jgi:hypothetical protein
VQVPAKRHVREFPVSPQALVAPSTPLNVAHFLPGQYVDAVATSVGKGFQGVMRRHNMKGMSRTHGQTKTHRKMGASGGGTNPGRVIKGKRMAGHMGNIKVQALSLLVFRIDTRWNVLFLKGCIPGPKSVRPAPCCSSVAAAAALLPDRCRSFLIYFMKPGGGPPTRCLPQADHGLQASAPHCGAGYARPRRVSIRGAGKWRGHTR